MSKWNDKPSWTFIKYPVSSHEADPNWVDEGDNVDCKVEFTVTEQESNIYNVIHYMERFLKASGHSIGPDKELALVPVDRMILCEAEANLYLRMLKDYSFGTSTSVSDEEVEEVLIGRGLKDESKRYITNED